MTDFERHDGFMRTTISCASSVVPPAAPYAVRYGDEDFGVVWLELPDELSAFRVLRSLRNEALLGGAVLYRRFETA